MAEVAIERASKVYPDGTEALNSLSLTILDGELMVFVGPSGCGKTTALRMIAGLESITSGTIRIGGAIVNNVEAQNRDIAMVFQNYALYPHMTVYKNLVFPLRIRGVSKHERDLRVRQVGKLLGLEEHFGRRPRQLSGGQRQRVAMGRAIVRQPRVFLMDEPLSNLDAKLRVQMRAEIGALQRELQVTTIYVTHDQVEAMTLGHRVAVMRGGVLQQVASPEELYAWPSNVFVAGFIGSPPMNLFDTTLIRMQRGMSVRIGASLLALNAEEQSALRDRTDFAEQRILVGIRPENFEEVTRGQEAPSDREITGTVVLREALGSDVLLHLQIEGAGNLSGDLWRLAHDVEDPAELEGGRSGRMVVARVSPETRTQAGDIAHLRIGKTLRFFDPSSGAAAAANGSETREGI